MELLLKLLADIPASVWPVFFGLIFLAVSFFEMKEETDKKGAKKRSFQPREKTFWPGAGLGAALMLLGFFLPSLLPAAVPAATPTNLPPTETETALPASPTALPVTVTSAPAPTELPTPAPTEIAAPAASPSAAPLALRDACIAAAVWSPVTTLKDAATPQTDERGCLDLSAWGITANAQGALTMRLSMPKQAYLAAIWSPVNAVTTIEFDVVRNALQIAYPNEPAAFEAAIIPISDPGGNTSAARFRLVRDSVEASSYTYFALADLQENNGTKISQLHYQKSGGYHVKLELDGSVMKVYIDGALMSKTLNLPAGPKALRLGYLASRISTLDGQILNLKIDGSDK